VSGTDRSPGADAPDPDAAAPPTEHAPSVASHANNRGPFSDAGWRLLADGRYKQAAALLEAQTSAAPMNAYIGVGYAFAVALTGKRDAAIPILRRAMHIDDQPLQYIPYHEPEVRKHLRYLYGRYFSKADIYTRQPDADQALMLAVVAFLLGEDETVEKAVEVMDESGEPSRALKHLKNTIEADEKRRADQRAAGHDDAPR